MKQRKVDEYCPNYPKKVLRTVLLTTAAAVAMTSAIGCSKPMIMGDISIIEPDPTDELVLDGEVAYDDTGLSTDGEQPEEPALMGKIVVPEDTDNP